MDLHQFEKDLITEELKILEDLDTTNVFNMRNDIKNFIECHVQFFRQGANMTIRQLNSRLERQSVRLKK